MSVLTPLLMLTVVAPSPIGRLQDLVTSYDYPTAAQWQDRGGPVGYRLTISAEGVPLLCEVVYSSGSPDLDAQTCAVMMLRARFTPARDGSGRASASIWPGVVNWGIPHTSLHRYGRGSPPPKPPPAEIELTIAAMPSGITAPATVHVAFAVASDGRLSDCTPILPSQPAPPEKQLEWQRAIDILGPTACASVLANLKPRPALDDKRQPISSIQAARVEFQVSGGR